MKSNNIKITKNIKNNKTAGFRKILVIARNTALALTAGSLLLTASGCRKPSSTGRCLGYAGDIVIEADRTPEDGFSLVCLESRESAGIGELAIDTMLATMNHEQSVAVDALSGATVTSLAVREAAQKALLHCGFKLDEISDRQDDLNIDYIYDSCDIAIVGAGAAGLTAAINAAKSGASVTVFEKMSIPGGSTARSGGKLMASGSELQSKLLVRDSNTLFASYLYDCSNALADSDRLMTLAENSSSSLSALAAIGVPFGESLEATRDGVQRVHVITDGEQTTGGLLIDPLLKQAERLGVRIVTNARVTELTTDPLERVTGLRALLCGQDTLIVKCDSVVLACGGFEQNDELVSQLWHGEYTSLAGLGNTGDGIELAANIGALTLDNEKIIGELFEPYADIPFSDGILVTTDGVRFCNEAGSRFEMYNKLTSRADSGCYFVFARDSKPHGLDGALDSGDAVCAGSIAELGERMGMDSLERVVEKYNSSCEKGNDSLFERDPKTLRPVSGKMYYIVRVGLRSYGSTGGIAINRACEVVSRFGRIEGLFAAGDLVSGNYFADRFPGFGSQLAVALETGTIAGQSASSYRKTVLARRLEQLEAASLLITGSAVR